MTRQEILAIAKPILFNAEMVRAILDNHKTVTRRVIKRKFIDNVLSSPARRENPIIPHKRFIERLCDAPYQVGDILYVRETWGIGIQLTGGIIYKADYRGKSPLSYGEKWKPSIHMPKEAARIFLRVTDVRVERLQDMNGNDLEKEGIKTGITHFKSPINNFGNAERYEEALMTFSKLWDSTVKKADIDKYGWDSNCWVYVYGFERVTVDK